jgi:hypothetical protein
MSMIEIPPIAAAAPNYESSRTIRGSRVIKSLNGRASIIFNSQLAQNNSTSFFFDLFSL